MPDFPTDELRVWFDGADFAESERLFPITESYQWREMQRGCARSGMKHIRVHDPRHSHASTLIHMGFSAVAVAARLGHESAGIAYRYAHLFPNVQDDMANSFQDATSGRKL